MDTFGPLYYFEHAAETYIRALQTGQKLRDLSDDITERTALELENYPGNAEAYIRGICVRHDAERNIYFQ